MLDILLVTFPFSAPVLAGYAAAPAHAALRGHAGRLSADENFLISQRGFDQLIEGFLSLPRPLSQDLVVRLTAGVGTRGRILHADTLVQMS